MSGGSTLSSCCPSVVTDVVVCPNPCAAAPLNCQDAISIAIQAILDLAQPNGSSASDIFVQGLAVCPDSGLTQLQIEDALATGARRGIFFRSIAAPQAIPTYMVIARMPLFNYQNKRYNRYPCSRGSFWQPSHNG